VKQNIFNFESVTDEPNFCCVDDNSLVKLYVTLKVKKDIYDEGSLDWSPTRTEYRTFTVYLGHIKKSMHKSYIQSFIRQMREKYTEEYTMSLFDTRGWTFFGVDVGWYDETIRIVDLDEITSG